VITVVARYRAQPDRADEIARVLAEHVAATRREPGCVQFVAYRSSDDADQFLLYEQYVDETAFEAHRASAHFRGYVEGTIVPLLAERRWSRYREVGAESERAN